LHEKFTHMNEPKTKIEITHYLIHRMSRMAKRHFKLHNQIYKGDDRNFVKLFDFLNAKKELNVKAVEAFFEKEHIKGNACAAYLLEKVIKTTYETMEYRLLFTENLIQPHLNTFYVYCEMQLFDLAYKELDKAEEIALKYHNTNKLFKIYELKRDVVVATLYNEEICEPVAILSQKRTDTIQKLAHQQRLTTLLDNIFIGIDLEEVYRELNAYECYYDQFMVSSKIHFNFIHSIYHHRKKNPKKALVFSTNCINLWDANPNLIAAESSDYFAIWTQLMVIALNHESIDIAQKHYERYKQLPQIHEKLFNELPEYIKIMYHMNIHLYTFIFILNFETYDKINDATNNIKKTLARYGSEVIENDILHSILFRTAYCNLLIENYNESDYWMNRLYEQQHLVKQVIIDESEILNLLLLYGRKYESLIVSRIKSLERKWKTTPPTSPNVLHMLKSLKKIRLKRNQKRLPQVFKEAHEDAIQIQKTYPCQLEFSKWIATKL